MTTETWLVMPAAAALAGAVLALIFDAFRARTAAVVAAVLAMGVAAALSAAAAGLGYEKPAFEVFQIAGPRAAVSAVVYALTGIVLLGGIQDLTRRRAGGQIAALAALSTVGAAIAGAAADIVLIVMGLEILAIAGYALVAAARTPDSAEASMKYFVQGAVATAFALLGIAVLLGRYGFDPGTLALGTSLAESATSASALLPALVGAVMLLAALAFKLGAVPFHSWAPDAYQSAPPVAAAVLASVPKIAAVGAVGMLFTHLEPAVGAFTHGGFTGLLRSDAVSGTASWLVDTPIPQLMAVLALFSILVGNLGALRQRHFSRMLGYSGIAQVGYVLVAFTALAGVSSVADVAAVWPAAIVLVIAYALATAGAFLGVQAIRDRISAWDGSIQGMAGLGSRMPAVAAALAVVLLSLTGIPLAVGFWGKLLVFRAAVDTGYVWLAVVGVLGSVVSFGYYGGVIRTMYLDAAVADAGETEAPLAGPAAMMCIVLALAVLALGIVPLFTGMGPFTELLVAL